MIATIIHFNLTNMALFWSGRRWVAEYPDALELSFNGRALQEWSRACERAPSAGDVCLVTDYGLVTERTRERREVTRLA